MNTIRYSSLAEIDLVEIFDYSTDKWGEDQAIAYLSDLVNCFEQIAKMPGMGRSCDSVHTGFLRIEQGKHVIFYRPERQGIFIARVLHHSMLPTRHRLIDA